MTDDKIVTTPGVITYKYRLFLTKRVAVPEPLSAVVELAVTIFLRAKRKI